MGYYTNNPGGPPPPLLTPLAGHPGAPRAVPPSQDTAYTYYATPLLSRYSITTPLVSQRAGLHANVHFFACFFFLLRFFLIIPPFS